MRIISILSAILICVQGLAQNTCGFDLLHKQQNDPSYLQQEQYVNQLLYQKALNVHSANRDVTTVLTIPVVVHIIHQNGPENLSDAQIIAGIDQLNLRFQNAAPYSDPTGTNVGIQFCLASVDPFGNPTTGITRNVSALGDFSVPGTSELAMKNLNRWDPHLYLNIWTLQNMGGNTSGAATMPSSVGNGLDGIGVQYNFFNSYVLTHEAGHYLGLYHTFDNNRGTCINANCMLDGDMVCDTPPDISNTFNNCPMNSCSTEMNDTSGFNPFTSDVNDVPNYMDYSNCPLSFTPGQAVRMNNALTLIRFDLLQSNGCGQHPGGALPAASFTFAPACGGTQVINTGTNTVGAQWDFDSDGQIDNAGIPCTWNAPANGTYTVTMYAQGFGGVDTTTQVIFAQHYPYTNYPLVLGYSGLNLGPNGFIACGGSQVTFYGEPGMAHYLWSTGDTTQNLSFVQGSSPQTISLSTIDSAGLTYSTCYSVHYDAAPSPIVPTVSVDPNDTVFCTNGTVDLLFTYSPIWASGGLQSTAGNIPGFHNSSYTATLASYNTFSVNQTDTNGCTASSNTVTINAFSSTYPDHIVQAGSYLMYSQGINFEWFLDGVPIPNSNNSMWLPTETGCYTVRGWWWGPEACSTFALDTVCLAFVGVKENSFSENAVQISPNPFSSETIITFDREQKNTSIKVRDILGKEIQSFVFSGKQAVLDLYGKNSGVYFVEITNEHKNVVNKKIVVE